MAEKSEYEVLNRIGKGSFGIVAKIKRKSDGKVLVWKEMDYGSMNDREKALIVSEVNILRELRHPHIVRYYDRIIDKKSSKIYIVMEYLKGGDLSQKIRSHRRSGIYIKEDWIWSVLAQLVLALKDCHRHRDGGVDSNEGILKPILHRDIKPGNVMIHGDTTVKLGDFGLAKELSSSTKFAMTYVGTPFYMSPELINDQTYDERCDIWALGCLIYELAALRPPFEAESEVALAKKINQGRFRNLPSQYSEDLYRVLRWMLHTNQSKRARIEDLECLKPIQRYMKKFIPDIRDFQLHRLSRRYTSKMNELRVAEERLKKMEEEMTIRERLISSRCATIKSRDKDREMEHKESDLSNS